MSFSSFSNSAQFTAQISMDSCSGARRISASIPSSSDLGVPPAVLQSFVTSSSLFPGILPFPKCFLRGTTSFTAGLSCAVQRVWHKADSAILPQRPPLQPPTASNCLSTHNTGFSPGRGQNQNLMPGTQV